MSWPRTELEEHLEDAYIKIVCVKEYYVNGNTAGIHRTKKKTKLNISMYLLFNNNLHITII